MNIEKQNAIKILKIAKGQIEGTIKMIEDDRYCIDISNQIMASQSLLKKANLEVLKQHMEHCVSEALKEGDGQKKIDELMMVLSKIMDK